MKLTPMFNSKSQAFILIFAFSLFCFTFTTPAAAQSNRTFTPAQLAAGKGKNGAPAYVAVNGLVYDLTSVPEWANGRHYCSGAIAGKDITFLWNLVPRSHKNPNFLKRYKVLGKLAAANSGQPAQTNPAKRTITPKELAAGNGQNGAPAYVAVNGLVYDLTSVPEWANGRHYCSGAIAGKDITFIWNLVPRSHKNPNFLKRYKVVGQLVDAKTQSTVPAPPSSEPSSQDSSLLKLLLGGFVIAVVITGAWLFLRLKR